MTARHSQWVVSYVGSTELRGPNQYLTDFLGALCCYWTKTRLICLSYPSVSSVYHPERADKTGHGGDKEFDRIVDRPCISILSRPSKYKGGSFVSLFLSSGEIWGKSGTHLKSTLNKQKSDFNSVPFVTCFNPRRPSVALYKMASFLGFIEWSRYSILLLKENHLFRFSYTRASYKNPRIEQSWNR